MIACVVASEEYLLRKMSQCSATASVSWRTAARRFVGKIGAGLIMQAETAFSPALEWHEPCEVHNILG